MKTKEELMDRYASLYRKAVASKDPKKMKALGEAQTWAFEQMAKVHPDMAESWLSHLEGLEWENWLSEKEMLIRSIYQLKQDVDYLKSVVGASDGKDVRIAERTPLIGDPAGHMAPSGISVNGAARPFCVKRTFTLAKKGGFRPRKSSSSSARRTFWIRSSWSDSTRSKRVRFAICRRKASTFSAATPYR